MDKNWDVFQTAHCPGPPTPNSSRGGGPISYREVLQRTKVLAAESCLDGEGRGRRCERGSGRRSDWSELHEKRIHTRAAASGRGYICERHNAPQFFGATTRVTCASPRGPITQFSAAALKRSDPKTGSDLDLLERIKSSPEAF